jgi:hypothetical protein
LSAQGLDRQADGVTEQHIASAKEKVAEGQQARAIGRGHQGLLFVVQERRLQSTR